MSSNSSQYQTNTKSNLELDEPKLFKVLLHNDNFTTMEFVVTVLETIFMKTPSEATQIMLHVHQKGVGTAGIYPHDIAETKIESVHAMAEHHNFPLKCSMEEA